MNEEEDAEIAEINERTFNNGGSKEESKLNIAPNTAGAVSVSARRSYPTAAMLQKTAAVMLPFYMRIATDEGFAQRWSKAVREADLDTLLRLFRQTVPVPPGHGRAYRAHTRPFALLAGG